MKREATDEDEYMPDAAPTTSSRPRGRPPRSLAPQSSNGYSSNQSVSAPAQPVKHESSDPTLGVNLKTSFPVARIKRIMQNDEEIGKVAQVTPHVVSRALELFMIKLITASADQARGVAPQTTGGGGKGPKRILVQHMKRAIQADKDLDFLEEVIAKVPDAPTGRASKKEKDSDSEDTKPKKKGKKRKDSGDDF